MHIHVHLSLAKYDQAGAVLILREKNTRQK